MYMHMYSIYCTLSSSCLHRRLVNSWRWVALPRLCW